MVETVKIKLLRKFLGPEGQRQFDIHGLHSKTNLEDVLRCPGKVFGVHPNVHVTRFTQAVQESEEPFESFISCLIQSVRPWEYSKVPAKKFEDVILVQQLITGIHFSKIREFLLSTDVFSSIIACAHEGHPGIVKTQRRAAQWYWWPRINATMKAFVENCVPCQSSDKTARPIAAPIQPVVYPMRPGTEVAIDTISPYSNAPTGKQNLLVATCYYAKWPEV